MKITVKIVLFAMLLALSMQSTAMAGTKYKLKPPGEIAKNLFGMGVDKAKENPELVEEAKKKMTGESETETPDSVEDKDDKEGMKNDK